MDGQPASDVEQGLPVVCPSCDGLLNVQPDGQRSLKAGETLRCYCTACARTVEVIAPPGTQTFVSNGVDAVEQAPISEFPEATPRPPS